ncbi:hypothetical protein M408DRAFT_65240 [Serendipita vermifera MAFF 305830]|uniref:Kri1-like C-terminal domain-containing protein n=1 Tax=Serendipita vermifera MAFF 305830 TaxID=933852 RepID=A0A0C2XQE5_SERVB|nr:hypothetical protein M408DRAFT_65240 [Serendipita vermifera MAFF 305830]
MLSDDDSHSSGDESIHQLTINEHFAKAYKVKKEREELQQLKEKYGSDAELEDEETDSEEDESEDEEGEELTPAMDVALLRTLAMIRSKNPAIYDASKNVFEAVSSDSDEDELLVAREKTKDEIEREEEEYREFLEREVGQIADIKELITVEEPVERVHLEGEGDTRMPRKEKKKKRKGNGGEVVRSEQSDKDFLLDYILNRGWVDKTAHRHPTYAEITTTKPPRKSSDDAPVKAKPVEDDDMLGTEEVPEEDLDEIEEEDNFDDLADRFESSYNFRFEEPGAATIATHPRNLPSLVRRQDTSRKEAREKRKQRKEEEKAMKREEVNRLKALKMREIRAKVDRIQKEGGVGIEGDILEVLENEIDEDWDPQRHDSTMQRLYEEDGAYAGNDDGKPTWDDDIDIDDIVGGTSDAGDAPAKKRKRKEKAADPQSAYDGVDEDQMDAEVAHSWEIEEAQWDGTEESRKRLMDKYMDEVYGLEFNDMIGDLPTRFKYTAVPSSSFALDPVEILMATDKELNQYMSVKRLAPYKNKNRGTWDRDRNEKLLELKQAISTRSWDGVPVSKWVQGGRGGPEGRDGGEKKKKRMGKKERTKLKAHADANVENTVGGENEAERSESERPRKKRKKNKVEA